MPGDVLAGKYRVEKVLGQGAMGVVVAATQGHLVRCHDHAHRPLAEDLLDPVLTRQHVAGHDPGLVHGANLPRPGAVPHDPWLAEGTPRAACPAPPPPPRATGGGAREPPVPVPAA